MFHFNTNDMKKSLGTIILSVLLLNSCENQLDINTQALLREELIATDIETVTQFLTAAYGILDGNLDNADVWRSAPSNWVYGEVSSDNAYKGSEAGDQASIDEVEAYASSPTNSFFDIKWRALYEGVKRSNTAIIRATNSRAVDGVGITPEEFNQTIGEARFLRGHYHFEAKKMWNKIPYIDEVASAAGISTPNTIDVWDEIEADFQAAIDNIGTTSLKQGRVNRWTAIAYLAKVHMYQLDYAAAKPLLDQVINEGPYDLVSLFSDNFNAVRNQDNPESIFAVQYSVNQGEENDSSGRWGDILNFPQTTDAGSGCCGFFQPSQNLVNAFKTDATGLPLLDTFNEVDVTSEEQQFNKFLSENDNDDTGYDATFAPEQGTLDPRLDRTVGRRGIDYQGFGLHEGRTWIRSMSNGGPFLPRKNVHRAEQVGVHSNTGGWTKNVTQINYIFLRFAEILLWRAEIAASEGDLATAVELVDKVRARAANPDDFVQNLDGTMPAANYLISEYGSFSSQEQAIKAVAFEQRLELAMEGHRFFELVRLSKASEVLSKYLTDEQTKIRNNAFATRQYLNNVSFEADDIYFPIPQRVIDESQGIITQN